MELLIVHIYSPKSAGFIILIVMVGLKPTMLRPFVHLNEGNGLPVALHLNSFDSPI